MAEHPTANVNATVGQRLHMPKMAELIAASLRRQIIRGELKEGDALPSEARLMEQFGVSRPTLREAFRVLESEALITIRRGSHGGARVKLPDGAVAARYAGLVLEHRGTTLRDVYDARSVLESSCAAMAAVRRDPAGIAELRSISAEIVATAEIYACVLLHGRFDAAVVRASGNETMIVLSSVLRTIIDKTTLESTLGVEPTPETLATFAEAHASHARLIELIEAGDDVGAARHWRGHLDVAKNYVLANIASGHSVLDLL